MKEQGFHTHIFDNGVTLLAEEIEDVSSAAVVLFIPSGAAIDPVGEEGTSVLLMEMLQKGAGQWGNRELSDQFEGCGVARHWSAGVEASVFSASMVSEHLAQIISLMSVVLQEPRFPEEELESIRAVALQDLLSLEDEPASKVMNELAQEFYPYPFGRSQLGTQSGIESVSLTSLQKFYKASFRSQPLYIGVAGKFDWPELKACVEKSFSEWKGTAVPLPVPELGKENKVLHLDQPTHQVQIALAYPSISHGHPDYYTARVGSNVLSGGMAGRLFIEVREKRGLVYRVGAAHSAARGRGAMFAYAGTTPENSEETLAVMLKELKGLGDGVTEEELDRAKVDLKAAVIMQSELSSVRASALVNDWWNLGRLRSLEEIRAAIEGVTNENIMRHLKEFPVSPVTLITLGPKSLELS